MIEANEISQEIVNTVLPYLIVGGQEITKGAAKDLWGILKGLFKKSGQENLLDEFESKPKDIQKRKDFESQLLIALDNNQNLISELKALVNTIKSDEEFKNIVNQIGNNNISVSGKINNSSININKN